MRFVTYILPITMLAVIIGACRTEEPSLAPTATQSSAPTVLNDAPARFTGTVTVDEKTPFEGMTIIAQVDSRNCGSTTVSAGRYVVEVASDEAKEGCGKPGKSVAFLVGGLGEPGGRQFEPKGSWDNSTTNNLDLTLKTN